MTNVSCYQNTGLVDKYIFESILRLFFEKILKKTKIVKLILHEI